MSDPLIDARAEGLRVVAEPLPLGASLAVLSEYDPAGRTIRVNSRALERVRRAFGEGDAAGFIAAAVAHELYHHYVARGRLSPAAEQRSTEARAERFARERYGAQPARFEALFL